MLKLNNIQLSFAARRQQRYDLLKGVNLEVPQGQITALVGGNGSGKTTLFNIISGFQRPDCGDIILGQQRINGMPPHRIAQLGVGRLFQGRQLQGDLSLLENMKLGSPDRIGENPLSALFQQKKIAQAEKEKEERAREIIDKLFGNGYDLDNPEGVYIHSKYRHKLNDPVSEFSYGEQRLIAIARLLMGNNRLLLLDEPTSGVNPKYYKTFARVIWSMAKEEGVTILLIEHNMHFVREVADRCFFLNEGRIIKSGTVNEVLDDPEVRNSYLGL